MITYSKHQFERFYQKYKARTFDQDDVAFFLVAARDYSSKNGVFRELGDFLAHPKQKDRGLIFEQLERIAPHFEAYLNLSKDADREVARQNMPPFEGLDRQDIAKELFDLFARVGINTVRIDDESSEFRDFIFCMIFLLSPFQLNMNGRNCKFRVEYGHSVTLSVMYESGSYLRNFAVLAVLSLPNVNLRWPIRRPRKLSDHIARRHKNGCLAAISYKSDAIEEFLNRNNLNANFHNPEACLTAGLLFPDDPIAKRRQNPEAWFLPEPNSGRNRH